MGKRSRKQKNLHRLHGQWPDPHTSAWFEQTLQHNPMAAFITGSIIHHAGRTDVCSVCGDTPAPIYDALDAPYQSLRLCADCLGIREADYDERYQLRSGRT